MFGIRQPDEGQVIFLPKFGKGFLIFRANDQNRGVDLLKFCKVLAQLRHMRAAEWSDEAAIKYEQEIAFFTVASQGHGASREIHQRKIGGGDINFYFWHIYESS